MKRRTCIAALGASIPIAGCLSESKAGGPDPNTTDNSGTEPSAVGTKTSDGAFSVGDPSGEVNPHELTVRNDSDRSWTIALRITDVERDETLLDRSRTLGGRESINGVLRGPAEYRVAVTVSDTGTEHVRTVGYFDTCNEYSTTVLISSGGTVTSESIRTEAACGV